MPYTIIPPQDPGTGTVSPTDLTGFTATRVPFGSAAGGLEDVADLTYNKTTHDLTLSVAESGGTVGATIANTSNTASSKTLIAAQVAGTSSDNAILRLAISGGQTWEILLDNTSADQLQITTSVGPAVVARCSTAGAWVFGTQATDASYAALFGRGQSTDGIKCIGTNFGLVEVYGGAVRLNVYAVSASSTRLGQTSAAIASLESTGANILLVGTPTSVPLRLCTNATSRLDISGAGVITTWDGATVSVGTTTGIKIGVATTEKIGFYNATPVVRPTRGATLTNNVTTGGTDDTIADFAGALYATDAGTIRDDIYQLARIVRQHDVALRALGLES